MTVVNVDEDHVALPRDLQDYYAFAPDVLGFPAASPIPKERRDGVLPPLPFVPGCGLVQRAAAPGPPRVVVRG